MTATTPSLAELDKAASDHWKAAFAARNRATLVQLHLIARLITETFPTARYLVLEPSDERPDHWLVDTVLDAADREITDTDGYPVEPGDLRGAGSSTNDVGAMVADLESDVGDWEVYATRSRNGYRIHLDLAEALDLTSHGGVTALLGAPAGAR